MKTLVSSMMIAVLLMTSGMTCQKQTPRTVTYQTLAAIGATVDAAADTAAGGRYAGKIDDQEWERLMKVHNKWLIAYSEACTIASYDFTKIAPADLVKVQTEFLTALQEVLK